MQALALATVFLGFGMIGAAITGPAFRRDWLGYVGMAVTAAGLAALIYLGQ